MKHKHQIGERTNLRIAVFAVVAWATTAGAASAQFTFQTLATFDGTQGTNPLGSLIRDSAGNLYGTTEYGGAHGVGTVFKVAAGTNEIITLASLDGTHGSNPRGGVVADSSGNLFGTTLNGGEFSFGSVFQVAAGTNELSTVASFDGTPHGSNSHSGLAIDGDGNLYGTTEFGGEFGKGTVFKIPAGTNSLVRLASFDSANGVNPQTGVIVDANGNLYGTTEYGGANGTGVVYKVAAGTNQLTSLVSFAHDGTALGANPKASLVADASGNLYGTTYFGGAAGYGVVFKVAAGSNALTRLASFFDTNGSNPVAGLILDASGNLYGTTKWDVLNNGTVFKVAAGTNTLTTLKLFDGTDGDEPHSSLIADAQGNLYGTTYMGGANGYGIVFKLQRDVPLLPGDYNQNGEVEAADYTVWRNSNGQVGSGLAADGNADNKIDSGDYQVWRSQFGMVGGAGANFISPVPEPTALTLIALAIAAAATRPRWKK